jgi:hypothetical protein
MKLHTVQCSQTTSYFLPQLLGEMWNTEFCTYIGLYTWNVGVTVTLWICIREIRTSISSATGYLDRRFCKFANSLQANASVAPSNSPRPPPSKFLLPDIQNHLPISFDAIDV